MIPDRVLNPEAFRHLIGIHGARVKYYPPLPCPCRNPQTGDFSRVCPLLLAGDCDGALAFREMTLHPRAKVYFDRAKKQIDDSELGLITVGDMMAYSMPDWVPLARGGKLVILDWWNDASETKQRGETDRERLIQHWAYVLDSVQWLDGSDWVDAVIGTDVTLVEDGSGNSDIVWHTANSPAVGQNYSTVYRYRPTVFVGGASFMPSRASSLPSPSGDPNARYGLPIRALMTYESPQRNSAG